MKIVLRRMTPGYRGMAMHAFIGAALLWGAALLDGSNSIHFLLRSWLIWVLILIAPFCHVAAYFGIKYFHLTQRIKSDTRRKAVTDSIRFWITMSSSFSLIYAELEGDQEAIAYIVSFFSKDTEFQVRLNLLVSNKGEKRNVLKLFSNEEISRGMAVTQDVNIVSNLSVATAMELQNNAHEEMQEEIKKKRERTDNMN